MHGGAFLSKPWKHCHAILCGTTFYSYYYYLQLKEDSFIMIMFSLTLFRVAAATYCSLLAPKNLLATLLGVLGMAHFSLGRGRYENYFHSRR